jgi:hypothetical protein
MQSAYWVREQNLPAPAPSPFTPFTADFRSANLGSLADLRPWGLGFQRASTATAQTGVSTVDTTAGVNQPRIGSRGSSWGEGLVLEESRTNYAAFSSPVSSTLSNVTFKISSPDGTKDALRYTNTGVSGTSFMEAVCPGCTTLPSGNLSSSKWIQAVSGTVNIGESSPNSTASLTTTTASTSWSRPQLTVNATACSSVAVDAEVAAGWTGAANIWGIQVEQGQFASELIPTNGSPVTRAGERLYYANGSALVDGGRLSMYVQLVPKGNSNRYAAPMPVWTIDANNYATINNTTGALTVTIGGVAQMMASNVVFNARDVVELYLAVGGNQPTYASFRDNGALTVLSPATGSPVQGNVAPTGAVDILSNGTTSEFSSWVQVVSFLASNVVPAGM